MTEYPEWLADTSGLRDTRLQAPDPHSGQFVVRASEIRQEKIQWLWPGWLAIGKITVLDGDPDVGKSTISCDIAAALTSRGHLPGGQRLESAAGVVFANAEDGVADTIVPRLNAAGADLDKCAVVRPGEKRLELPHDLHRLDDSVSDVGARLVVVDPLMAHLPQKKNSWNDQHMREVLSPVKAWAEQVGVAILLIRHPNKRTDTKAIYRGGGSIGIIGAARSGLYAAVHPSDPSLRVLSSSNCNLRRRPSSLVYRIVESDVDPEIGVVEWMGEIVLTADDLVGFERSSNDGEIDRAKQFLSDLLSPGAVASTEVFDRASEAGFSKRTLDRAKDKLGVRSRKQGSQWVWQLPTEPDYSTNGVATDVPF